MEMLESYTTVMATSSEGRHNRHALCTSYFFEMSLHTQCTLEHLEKIFRYFPENYILKKEKCKSLHVRNDIRHDGASLVHLLWHFNLQRDGYDTS